MHLPRNHIQRGSILCVRVCAEGGDGGMPIIKSSVRAEQDPVNQAACEKMKAGGAKGYESSSLITPGGQRRSETLSKKSTAEISGCQQEETNKQKKNDVK